MAEYFEMQNEETSIISYDIDMYPVFWTPLKI